MRLLRKEYLLECYRLLKKQKAAGIDGRTIESYTEQEIAEAIAELAQRIHERSSIRHTVLAVYNRRCNLRAKGLLIPDPDLYIAATALHHELTLVTRNLKDYTRVPHLKTYPSNKS
jgi:predicted nucleic acid-binding protein